MVSVLTEGQSNLQSSSPRDSQFAADCIIKSKYLRLCGVYLLEPTRTRKAFLFTSQGRAPAVARSSQRASCGHKMGSVGELASGMRSGRSDLQLGLPGLAGRAAARHSPHAAPPGASQRDVLSSLFQILLDKAVCPLQAHHTLISLPN